VDVGAFLSGESGASQVGLGQSSDLLRSHGAGKSLQSSVSGTARRERYLLLEDDLYEGLEARRTIPERRRTVLGDNVREVRVATGELCDSLRERVSRQLHSHFKSNEPSAEDVRRAARQRQKHVEPVAPEENDDL
jgi:hypothetical protein